MKMILILGLLFFSASLCMEQQKTAVPVTQNDIDHVIALLEQNKFDEYFELMRCINAEPKQTVGEFVTHTRRRTALPTQAVYWAARHGNIKALQELYKAHSFEKGASSELISYFSGIARIAAEFGQCEVLKAFKNLINIPDPKDGMTPLHVAARYGKIEVIKCLKELGANMEAVKKNGFTPLHTAAEYGQIEAMQCLIDLGSSIESRTFHGSTPMGVAAQSGQVGVLKFLKKLKANVNAPANDGSTPMHMAAQFDQIGALFCLAELGADIDARNKQGMTPLLCAAEFGKIKALRCLKQLGADFEAICLNGSTVLHFGVKSGNRPTIKYLLDNGAKIYSKNQQGKTPFDLVGGLQRRFIEYWFRLADIKGPNAKAMNGRTLLMECALEGFETIVQDLLKMPTLDVTIADEDGNTALHVAAISGKAFIVDLLLKDSRTNVHQKNKAGNTAFHEAAANNKPEIVAVFLKHGANPGYSNSACKTVREVAERYSELKALFKKWDKEKEAAVSEEPTRNVIENIPLFEACSARLRDIKSPNSPRAHGRTFLMECASNGFADLVKELLENPTADCSVKDNFDETVMHHAARAGNAEVLELLLRDRRIDTHEMMMDQPTEEQAYKRTNIYEKSKMGDAAFHLAAAYGKHVGVRVFLAFGVNQEFCNKKGQTMRDIALGLDDDDQKDAVIKELENANKIHHALAIIGDPKSAKDQKLQYFPKEICSLLVRFAQDALAKKKVQDQGALNLYH